MKYKIAFTSVNGDVGTRICETREDLSNYISAVTKHQLNLEQKMWTITVVANV